MINLQVNDVTALNPKSPWAICQPKSQEELKEALLRTTGPVTVAGGRYSMGGQTAQNDALMIDMTHMNKILFLDPVRRLVRVQAGVRWRQLQEFLDPHDLSVSIMQTYSNFTVGGAIGVNCHGRYMGKGPVSMSVKELTVMLADGSVRVCSREVDNEIFAGVIGGLGALGIIVEALLEVDENCHVERIHKRMNLKDYREHFLAQVRSAQEPVFHNADLYPPHYRRVNAVTWRKTDADLTDTNRLMPIGGSRMLEKYFMWAISETPFGKERRELYIDPLLFAKKVVRTRNCEASYDVEELEPSSRKHSTYVLQEYFVPARNLEKFIDEMRQILKRHRVNMINVSIRHAKEDHTSTLTWAKEETYALVLYYKQRVRHNAKMKVGVWTRELVNAAIQSEGCYYLPYQPHASFEQFCAAYPGWERLFEVKQKLDPNFKFQGSLWSKYYEPWVAAKVGRPVKPFEGVGSIMPLEVHPEGTLDVHKVFSDQALFDRFYMFLQNVFQMGPEDRMQALIAKLAKTRSNREDIFRELARESASVKPWHAPITYALPSLFRQKKEMRDQIMEIMGARPIGNHLEIGSHGRYISALPKATRKQVVVMPEKEASVVDWIERMGPPIGHVAMLSDYDPIRESDISKNSLDSVTCLIGLHHCAPEKLDIFLASLVEKMKIGGIFIVRDHDVKDEGTRLIASLAHEVFGAVLGDPWEAIQSERRHFDSCSAWSKRLELHGLRDMGFRIAQKGDSTDNLLMGFEKIK